MAVFGGTGPEQLQALGLRLKALGAAGNGEAASYLPRAGFGRGKTLRGQLTAGVRIAAKPLVKDARDAARTMLPHAGGFNESVAKSEIKVATVTSGPRVGVRITNRSKGGRGANAGYIRHPVFAQGDRKSWRWVNQSVPGATGWFDQTLEAKAPTVMGDIRAAMEIVAIEATRRF